MKTSLFLALLMLSTSLMAQIKKFDMLTVFEQRFDLRATKIVIDGQFCHVVVNKSTDGHSILVGKLEAMAKSDDYKVIVDESNDEAKVHVTVSNEEKSSFAGELTLSVSPDVKVIITTVSGYVDIVDVNRANVEVKSNSGKLRASDTDGLLDLNSRSGIVSLKNLKGEVNVETASGAVTAEDVEGSLSIETISGAVNVDKTSDNVKIKTTSGNIDVNNIKGTLTTDNSSGFTKISTTEGVVNAKTYSGAINFFKVKCEMHIETYKGAVTGSSDITLTASSDFTSDQGKINLRLKNDKKDLSFNMKCTENKKANLMAKGTSKNKKLQEGNGSIIITATSRIASMVFQ